MIAIIPARGNSKRLPRKNLLPINGIPLVVRAIRCAKEAGIFKRVVVTSEDHETLRLANCEGATAYNRYPLMSDDQVQTASVVFDVLMYLRLIYSEIADSFCVLNPTSPLRTPELLREIYKAFNDTDYDCLMTVGPNGKHDGTALFCKTFPFLRVLDFHTNDPTKLLRGLFPIPASLSSDINTAEDFARAEAILRKRGKIAHFYHS